MNAREPRLRLGFVYALTGALLFGANGSLTKLLVGEDGLSAPQLTLLRTLGTAVLAGLVLLVTDRSAFRIRPRQMLVMAVLGITGVALLQALYAAALGRLPVGITLLLEYMAVLMVPLVGLIVFRERVKPRLWIAIACVLAGLAVVARVWDSHLDALGVVFALGAAVSLTVYFVVGERQVSASSPMAVAFWTMLFAGLFWAVFSGWWTLDPATFATGIQVGGAHVDLELPMWLLLLVTIVFGSFLSFSLSFAALRHLTATAAGVAASAEVLFAFAVAWLWLGEGLDTWQLLGAAAVLAGIVVAQTARAGKVVDADLTLPTGPLPILPDDPPGPVPDPDYVDPEHLGSSVAPDDVAPDGLAPDVGGRT